MNYVFNIISCTKTNWPGMPCNIVWYMLRIAKSVAASACFHTKMSTFSMRALILWHHKMGTQVS